MPASEPGSEACQSRFVPRCANLRRLACWLLALAGCLNPVPDTDPSLRDSDSAEFGPGSSADPGLNAGQGADDGDLLGEVVGPDELPPPVEPAVPGVVVPDAGAPSPPVDAGADADPEDEQ